jgi:hypothetical protein
MSRYWFANTQNTHIVRLKEETIALTNPHFDEVIHQIRVRGDGTEYVRIKDVDNNWIEVDVTPDNEEEFRNPNGVFKKTRLKQKGAKRVRKHPPRKDIIDRVRIEDWGRNYVDVHARFNYDENTPTWEGGIRVPHPDVEKIEMRMFRENPGTPQGQLKKLRRQWLIGYINEQLRNMYMKKDPRAEKIEIAEEVQII